MSKKQNGTVDRRHPTGFRKLSPAAMAWATRSTEYDGLPEEIEQPHQLLSTVRRASRLMGISSQAMEMLEYLFRCSQDQDWRPGSQPIVWPGNARMSDDLHLETRQVTNRLNRLIEAGLVVDMPNPQGGRSGRRGRDGKILEAYGLNLCLLAVRYEEIARLADQAQREQQAKAALRKSISISRRALRQVAEAGMEYGVPGYDWAAVEALSYGNKPSRMGDLRLLEREAESLAAEKARAEKHFNDHVENTPQHETNCTPTIDTTQKTILIGIKNGLSKKGRKCTTAGVLLDPSVTPGHIHAACPAIADHLETPPFRKIGWRDTIRASNRLRERLGVSSFAWDQACMTMGEKYAAVAMAITAVRHGNRELESPGGYFVGIVRKWEAGEANLEGSIWGFLKHQ